jgi:hypothetical protein
LTKIYSAIYEHNMLTVNIYFFMRISRVLCFFKHFYGLNCIKVIDFSSLYQIFSVGTKQGNDSNVKFYYTIRFPYFISLTLFIFFIFVIKRCIQLVCIASLLITRQWSIRTKTGWLGIMIMCESPCLSAEQWDGTKNSKYVC